MQDETCLRILQETQKNVRSLVTTTRILRKAVINADKTYSLKNCIFLWKCHYLFCMGLFVCM